MRYPEGWAMAWKRSIPIEHKPDGYGLDGPETVKRLKEHDSSLVFMYDVWRARMTIWRKDYHFDLPLFVADVPAEWGVIDGRTYAYVVMGDTINYPGGYHKSIAAGWNKSQEAYAKECDEAKEKAIDNEKLEWAKERYEKGNLFIPVA